MSASSQAEMEAVQVIAPQKGPQEQFLASTADIVIYGGSAGGGKTYGLLLEQLRHCTDVPGFASVIFRRNAVQVRNPGGLWDESMKLFPYADAQPRQTVLEWLFPVQGHSYNVVKFAHLEHETSVLDWQGSQIPLICFDELTHFSRAQFFYMLSRNRSVCGVKPYLRATCNPDADSWVAEFIEWWIDQETGFAIPERSGQVRWFIRVSDTLMWADSREELMEKYGDPTLPEDHEEQVQPKSLTFISSSIYDNKILMKEDPGYLGNLKALPYVERMRLLGGNWKVRPAAGLLFKREWVEVVETAPAGIEWVRYWDLAATPKIPENDPDWTVGTKMGKDKRTGFIYVAHMTDLRETPKKVRETIKNMASSDGKETWIGLPQDPAQAGKSQVADYADHLEGYRFRSRAESGDKVVRFGPFSAQAEAGNVKVIRGNWNDRWFGALEAFPDAAHDDHADSASGAYAMLAPEKKGRVFVKGNRG